MGEKRDCIYILNVELQKKKKKKIVNALELA